MNIDIDLTHRGSFNHFTMEKIRFSDTDMMGHVNNVAFAALLESGRTAYGHEFLFPHLPPGVVAVMARVEIDYRRELHWPSTVDIGNRIVAVGRSSYVIGQGLFKEADCVTTGRTTIVLIDRNSRRSTPISENYRAKLEGMMRIG